MRGSARDDDVQQAGEGGVQLRPAELAEHRVAAGVVLSNSRGPESLAGKVAELGPGVSAAPVEEAVRRADVVMLAVPLKAVQELPPHLLDGKVVLDAANYYPERDGQIPALDELQTTTSQIVAEHFPGARVVKGSNNIIHLHLVNAARPNAPAERSTLPIAGDDPEAKRVVTGLLERVGYDVLDTGGLAESWRFENGQPAYCLPYVADVEELKASSGDSRPVETRRVTTDELHGLLAEAPRRAPEPQRTGGRR